MFLGSNTTAKACALFQPTTEPVCRFVGEHDGSWARHVGRGGGGSQTRSWAGEAMDTTALANQFRGNQDDLSLHFPFPS